MQRTFSKVFFILGLLVFLGAGCLSLEEEAPPTTGPGGMFVSVDKGDTWRSVSKVPRTEGVADFSSASVFRIIEDPQDSSAMYWASRNNGMLFTYDDAKTWQQPVAPMNKGFVYSVAVHPTDKCTIFATNGKFVYKSIDCNRTWEEVYRESRGTRVNSVAFNPFPPHQTYIAIANGDIIMSADLGTSWSTIQRFKKRSKVIDLFVDQFLEGHMYVVTREAGIQITKDGGETWESTAEEFKKFSKANEYRRFVMHPTKGGVLYWMSTYGILVSQDAGVTWEPMELITAPGSVSIYAFAVNPQNDLEMYYTATQGNNSTLYRTVDGGKTWITKRLPSGQIPTVMRVHPETPDWIYVGFTIPPEE